MKYLIALVSVGSLLFFAIPGAYANNPAETAWKCANVKCAGAEECAKRCKKLQKNH